MFKIDIFHRLKNNITFRNGIVYVFFAFFNNGFSFLLLLILAKFIGPSDFGSLNLFNNIILLMGILISLNSTSIISITFFQKNKSDVNKYINISTFISFVLLLILVSVILIFQTFFKEIVGISLALQIIALLICFFQVINNIHIDTWKWEEKPVKYGMFNLVNVLLNFIFTLLLVIYCKIGWEGRAYAQIGVSFFMFLLSLYILYRREYFTFQWPDLKYLKEALLFGLPLIPHILSFWLRQGLDRFILNAFYTVDIVGYFSFAYIFASIILIIGTAFDSTISVNTYKVLGDSYDNARRFLHKQMIFLSGIFIILTLLVLLVSYSGIIFLFTQYSPSLSYIFPLCISAFFTCLTYIFINILFYMKKTRQIMYITLSITLVHVAASLLFTRFSPLITAYNAAMSSMLVFIIMFIYTNRVFPLFKFKKI